MVVQILDEDVLVKMLILYDSIINNENLEKFVMILTKYCSTRMIISLFDRSTTYIKNEKLVNILESHNLQVLLDHIQEIKN